MQDARFRSLSWHLSWHPFGPPFAALFALALCALVTQPARAQAAAVPPPARSAVAGAAEDAPSESEGPPTLLWLYDGGILWGFVEGHDPDALRFLRLDNGGRVRLPWAFLDPAQSLELRERWGYVERDSEEVWADADRLVLLDGSELVGVVVNRTDDYLYVKTARSLLTLPKLQVTAASRTRVPALDLYTREELYAAKRAELFPEVAATEPVAVAGAPRARPADTLDLARRELELARFCERIFDYVHAFEHYGRAKERWSAASEGYRASGAEAPAFPLEDLESGLRVAERKAAAQVQADELARIDWLRARARFDDALVACEAFPARFPDSPLLEDLTRLRKRVLEARERELHDAATRALFAQSARLAREAARTMGFEQATAWVEDGLHQAVLEAVAKDLQDVARGVAAEDVQRLWSERKPGRYHRASYGQGTWLLGEERALSGLEGPAKAEETTDSRDPERRALEERIRRYLENQKLALRARSGQSSGDDPEAFWRQWTTAGRSSWILALYAEHSGQFQVREIRFQNCRECGGTGVREVFHLTAGPSRDGPSSELQACVACHHIGKVRRLSYR